MFRIPEESADFTFAVSTNSANRSPRSAPSKWLGQLHGEKEAGTFRLEAMRAGSGAGYEVAVCRQQKVLAVAPARNSGAARPEPVQGDRLGAIRPDP